MERTTKECNVATDRFTAGKTTDRLVDDCLENRGRKIFSCGTFIDQRLDVCFGKNTAAGCNWIDRLVIFRIFIQTGGICLDQGSHLVNKRTCTAGTDTVHTLFYITAFKIDDLCILTTKLDRNICLRSIVL